jgi:hypothetical protein
MTSSTLISPSGQGLSSTQKTVDWSSRSPYCLEYRPPPKVRAKWATKTREARGYGAAYKRLREEYAG